jgi:drug/metabolite transporter (DMT)-like permease
MKKLAPFFIILSAMFWGVDGIVFRPFLYSLPVDLVVFLESLLVSILLIPFVRIYQKELKNLTKSEIINFIGIAAFGGAIGTMAITKALFYVNYVNLSVVILIQKFQPLFAISLAAILLKEKLDKMFFIWAVLALFGSYMLTFGFSLPDFTSQSKTITAAMFSLLAAFSFGFSTVLSKRGISSVSFQTATILRFYITLILMFAITLFTGNFSEAVHVSQNQVLIFLAIAFSTGGLAIILYYIGLKYVKASDATILELAFPVTAIILDYLIHGNVLAIPQLIGGTILVLSILQITRFYGKPKLKK